MSNPESWDLPKACPLAKQNAIPLVQHRARWASSTVSNIPKLGTGVWVRLQYLHLESWV